MNQVTLFPATNELIWTVINVMMLFGLFWAFWRLVTWRRGPGRFTAAPGGSRAAASKRQCPKCQAAMAAALPHDPVKGKITAYREPVKALWPGDQSALTVFVCPSCGFAEWYADHPEQFRSHDA